MNVVVVVMVVVVKNDGRIRAPNTDIHPTAKHQQLLGERQASQIITTNH